MDAKLGAILDNIGAALEKGSKAVVIFNFVINMILSGALQEMFAAMKKMQIMIHLLLVNVIVPANCQMFFNSLLSLVTYDIIEFGPYITKWMKLYDDEPLSDSFDSLGYLSKYMIINMSSLFLGMIILGCGLSLILCLYPFVNIYSKAERWSNYLKKKLLWEPVLRFLNESYLIISISVFINLAAF